MFRTLLLAVGLLLIAGHAAGQTNSDLQTLQSILEEIRLIREDLRTTSVASQRAQILFYRLQLQEAVVRQLQDRVDDARSKVTQAQREIKMFTTDMKRHEEEIEQTDNEGSRKQIETIIAQIKASNEIQTSIEQEYQAKLTEAEDQLRIEKGNLARLQDELDRLDKTLSPSSK
jgi:chromosome segregation ATPase